MISALNGGNRKSGFFWRNKGDHHEPEKYGTHAAAALSGIKLEQRLPRATLKRSIIIQMQRAKKGQLKEIFRTRIHSAIFERHGERLLRWCNDHREELISHEPTMPGIDGREYDNWESIVSIAEVVSPEWGNRLLNILRNQTPLDSEDAFVMLLRDCRRLIDTVFQGQKAIKPADMAEELGRLSAPDDRSHLPWARFHDKYREEDARIKSADVTKFLSTAGVMKKTIRTPEEIVYGHMVSEILNAQETYASMPDEYDSGYVPGEDRDDGNGQWLREHAKYSEEESRDAIPF